jgi:hypothetical protein
MLVESDYRGYRIEVIAFEIEDGWDADVRILRAPSRSTLCAGHLNRGTPTAEVAEASGAICARRWIDRHGRARRAAPAARTR